MVILACIAFLLLLCACASWDALHYRIPDVLTAPLFVGALVATFIPGWPVATSSALAGFLFLYPALFLMWSGRSLVPVGTTGETARPGLLPWKFVLSHTLVPSPVSWLVLLALGTAFVDPMLVIALPVGLAACALTALKVSPSMPWHSSRLASSWLGGGDVKMLFACMALVGTGAAQQLSLCLAAANLVLIAWLRIRRRRCSAGSWEARRMPMGVAISAATGGILIVQMVLN